MTPRASVPGFYLGFRRSIEGLQYVVHTYRPCCRRDGRFTKYTYSHLRAWLWMLELTQIRAYHQCSPLMVQKRRRLSGITAYASSGVWRILSAIWFYGQVPELY